MDNVNLAEVVCFRGYFLNDAKVVQRCKLNTMGKAWCIFVTHHFLPIKNLVRVGYDRLRYLYAIRKGYNINIGKMIVHNFDILMRPIKQEQWEW